MTLHCHSLCSVLVTDVATRSYRYLINKVSVITRCSKGETAPGTVGHAGQPGKRMLWSIHPGTWLRLAPAEAAVSLHWGSSTTGNSMNPIWGRRRSCSSHSAWLSVWEAHSDPGFLGSASFPTVWEACLRYGEIVLFIRQQPCCPRRSVMNLRGCSSSSFTQTMDAALS